MVIISAIKRNRLTDWIKNIIQASKMTQCVKVPATESDTQDLYSRGEEPTRTSCPLVCGICMHVQECVHTHYNNIIINQLIINNKIL